MGAVAPPKTHIQMRTHVTKRAEVSLAYIKKKLFGCNDPRYYGVRMTDDEIKGIRRSAEKPQPQICSNTHILGRGKGGIHGSRETSTVNKAGGEQHNGARPDHKTYP